MGLKLDKLKKNPVQFHSLTGFSSGDFDELATEFRIEWDQYSSHFTLDGKQRQRIALPRKTNVLPGYQDKLLFILVYLKTFPLQELQAVTFSMSQPQANFWIHLLSPVLRKTIKRLKELPERNSQKLELLLKDCFDVLLDGVERNIQRPQDSEQQKECYSGKKTHSIKNNVLSLPDRRIMFLSQTYGGSVHDKRICDQQPLHLPGGISLWQDTGFIGHCPDGVNIQMPTKKPKGKELTNEQKQENREISRFRVLVEHAICGAKRCRIVKDRLRCHKFGFEDLIMELACGLHNFRITLKE